MERLAIDGGTPVRGRLLPYGHQVVDEADVQAVVEALRSDWLTTGPKVAEFEEAFAAAVDARYAVAVSSGTAALHGAAFAAGIGPDDEVITTPMTFAATANCIRYQGSKVVFADVEPRTLNIAVGRVEEAITPQTRAIIPVDYAGQPADLDELYALAEENHLVVIEDAAHALGATYKGRKVGSLATMTVFSFHPVKHITTGEGGLITTNDSKLAERLRAFRNHGISINHRQREVAGAWFYEMRDLGYNYRITDIGCALGLSQLKKLPGWMARRREIAARYTAEFTRMPEVEPPYVLEAREPSWHLYVLRLHLERLRVDRSQVFRAMRAENIGVNVHYIPVPWHPYYRKLGYGPGHWPVAEGAYERMLTLPLWPGMTDADVQDTVEAVRKVVAAYRK
jgi:perosamine synthetase